MEDLESLEIQAGDDHKKLLNYQDEINNLNKQIQNLNVLLKGKNDDFKMLELDYNYRLSGKDKEIRSMEEMVRRKDKAAKNHTLYEARIKQLEDTLYTLKNSLAEKSR